MEATRSHPRSAFIETGALVAGGIGGSALAYVLLSDHWLVMGIFAVAGAWLVRSFLLRS